MTHENLAVWAAASLVAGLLSFFSPCVAPLLPGYVGYLASSRHTMSGSGDADGARVATSRRGAYLFVAGFSATFIASGLVSGAAGSKIVALRTPIETLAGAVMLLMGAFLLGLLPRAAMSTMMRDWRMRVDLQPARRFGMLGPVLLGVVFAAGWTPCVGPMLAAILSLAALTGSTLRAGLLLSIYSAGFALPLLAIAYGWSGGSFLSRAIMRHYDLIAKVSGVLLIAVGLIYLAGHASVFAIWATHIAGIFGR